jgi:hypothetical protein
MTRSASILRRARTSAILRGVEVPEELAAADDDESHDQVLA